MAERLFLPAKTGAMTEVFTFRLVDFEGGVSEVLSRSLVGASVVDGAEGSSKYERGHTSP